MGQYDGKRVVITGVASGIGLAAKLLLDQGAPNCDFTASANDSIFGQDGGIAFHHGRVGPKLLPRQIERSLQRR